MSGAELLPPHSPRSSTHGGKVAELVGRWLEWRQSVTPVSPGTAGSRLGELRSLRWTAVDVDHGEVLIDCGVIHVPGRPLIDQDRTRSYTMRRVAVGPATLELPRAHRVEQAQVALASGVSLAPDAYGFSNRWKDDGERCAELLPIRDWLSTPTSLNIARLTCSEC